MITRNVLVVASCILICEVTLEIERWPVSGHCRKWIGATLNDSRPDDSTVRNSSGTIKKSPKRYPRQGSETCNFSILGTEHKQLLATCTLICSFTVNEDHR